MIDRVDHQIVEMSDCNSMISETPSKESQQWSQNWNIKMLIKKICIEYRFKYEVLFWRYDSKNCIYYISDILRDPNTI